MVVAPVAILLALLVFGADSVLGVIALVVAFAMLATALISWCPMWRTLGLNTCAQRGRPSDMRPRGERAYRLESEGGARQAEARAPINSP